MAESLFSALWYRIAARHPRLRADVAIRRQQARGQAWYVLSNAADGRHFRVNAEAWRLVGRCDGRRPVQQIWDGLLEELRDDAPTQDEVIRTLAGLERAGMLCFDDAPDGAVLQRRHDEARRRGFVNPFAMRVSLGNPSAWLRRIEGIAAWIFRPAMLATWVAVMAAAALAAAANWNLLHAHAVTWMATPRYLALALIAYPFIKALHELGHALAVRRWGGAVPDAGFSLFVLVPAPYVDASAATAFRTRRQRLAVGAAGIMVELALAAAALAVWLNVEPGLVRDLAFVTLFIASVSTLLFNGNPLMPFDGYYVLCDALDLPNLAGRSRQWWAQKLMRIAGQAPAAPLEPARGEAKWLAAYAPLSLAYRIAVSLAMILWIGAKSFVLGTIAAAIVAVLLVVRPTLALAARLRDLPAGGPRRRAAAAAMGALATALVFLFAVPAPHHTVAAAVVWPAEQSRIRPGADGFVAALPVADGARVSAGDLVLRLEDPALLAQRAQLASQAERLQSREYAALPSDAAQAQNAAVELDRVREALARVETRIASLEVRAQAHGVLVMPRQQDLPGTLVREGETVGYVMSGGETGIRAAVPEYDAALVRERTRRTQVLLAEDAGGPREAHVVRDIPAATRQLPSAALGDRGGGAFVTDPGDKDGLRSLEPVVLVDLRVGEATARVGGRAWVRFDHEAEPLGWRWLRRGRQMFLQSFNPGA
jgi:putative peptide zinc metalloprotease protein